MHILLTNDDGIHAEGLRSLEQSMADLGEVWVVAPTGARNAIGRALTLHRPLRVLKITDHKFSIDGTPSDCVNLAVNSLLPEKPCLVVSGINRGANLADDISYSGTVAASFEATILGIPSLAVSLDCRSACNFAQAAVVAARISSAVLASGLPQDTFLNINIPHTLHSPLPPYQLTFQGRSIYDNVPDRRFDPRGGVYYWIGGDGTRYEHIPGSDADAVLRNCVSITPITTNLTQHAAFSFLKNWHAILDNQHR